MRIEQKIAEWALLPVEHGESFYLLNYKKGEQYEPHYDYFTGEDAEKHIGSMNNYYLNFNFEFLLIFIIRCWTKSKNSDYLFTRTR